MAQYKKKSNNNKKSIKKNKEVINNKEAVDNLVIPNVYKESEIVDEIDMSCIEGITFDPANLTAQVTEPTEDIDSLKAEYNATKAHAEEILLKIVGTNLLKEESKDVLSTAEKATIISAYKAFEERMYGKDRYDASILSGGDFCMISTPLELNCTRSNKIHSLDDVYTFTKYMWDNHQYDGSRLGENDEVHDVVFENTIGHEYQLADGRHFLRECMPFGIQNCMRLRIFIPTNIFNDVMAKFTVDESVYFESGECPDAAFGRKIINGSVFPGGNIVHHFNFPAFYLDKEILNQCIVEIIDMDEDTSPRKKMRFQRPLERLFYKTINDMETIGHLNVIRAIPEHCGPVISA